MAQTFTDAFVAVASPELDLATGFEKKRPEPKPVPARRASNWAAFKWSEMARVIDQVSYTTRSSIEDAQEAVGDTYARLMEREPERFDEADAMELLGLIRAMAQKRVLKVKEQRIDSNALSLDALFVDTLRGEDDGESGLLNSGRITPVVAHFKAGVDEDARFTPLPKPGERFNRSQAIGAVQRFRDETGRAPTTIESDKRSDLPNMQQIRRLGFKGINDLLLEAGVPIEHPSRTRRKWLARDTAHACYSYRRRTGFWPNGNNARRLPAGTLPPQNAMQRYLGGSSAGEVQRGVEDILGPIDQPTWKPSGELTARLRRSLPGHAGIQPMGEAA